MSTQFGYKMYVKFLTYVCSYICVIDKLCSKSVVSILQESKQSRNTINVHMCHDQPGIVDAYCISSNTCSYVAIYVCS